MQNEIPMILEREAGMPAEVKEVAVGFGMQPIKDKAKSEEAGRPIYREAEFIQIAVPGDKQSLVLRTTTNRDRQRFPRAYEAFKQRATTPLEGTPIEMWPQVSRSEVLNLKAYNIFTVEMLATVNDGNVGNLGFNARELVGKARAYVAQSKDTASTQKMAAENQALKDQLADMQRQITELAGKRRPQNQPAA